jgi:t-SNARE complex subunit (syntaxin)
VHAIAISFDYYYNEWAVGFIIFIIIIVVVVVVIIIVYSTNGEQKDTLRE